MSDADLRAHAEEIQEQFSDHLDVDVEDVQHRLEQLVDEYKVPVDEARRSVTNHYLDEAGLERDEMRTGNDELALEDVDEPEEWIDITAKVVELWEPRADAIGQVGLLGDDTGTIKFTAWAKSDLPELEEGTVYRLGNVVTDEYEGQFSVKLNRTTTVTELDEELEVGDDSVEIEGAMVDVQSGSGLIKRCPEKDCTRVLENGRCSEHGGVDGEFDLRIKAVIDDGREVHDVIFDREATEELTGMTMDEAIEMAQDALDTTVVADEMRSKVLGWYYRVRGPTFRRYVLADEAKRLDGPVDTEETLIKARSI
ncbi:replication factor A [Halobacteriales archaeon QS_8_69_26]|nr:MAG: replication factor A [Halobacteriales archaeon QS_8_69_26]